MSIHYDPDPPRSWLWVWLHLWLDWGYCEGDYHCKHCGRVLR